MSIDFSTEQVSTIIKKVDLQKAHEHGKISVCMLKLCNDSINTLIVPCLKIVTKKEFTTHKINYKQTLTNYQPVFFLLVWSNIFKRIICNAMHKQVTITFRHLICLLFVQGIHVKTHILSITHDIYHSLDEGFETTVMFLDISKAFDKV